MPTSKRRTGCRIVSKHFSHKRKVPICRQRASEEDNGLVMPALVAGIHPRLALSWIDTQKDVDGRAKPAMTKEKACRFEHQGPRLALRVCGRFNGAKGHS